MFLDLVGGLNKGLSEFGAEQKAEEERQLKLSGERQRQELLGNQEARTAEMHPLKKRELTTKVNVGEAQGSVAISQADIDLNKLDLQSKVFKSEDGQSMLTDIISNKLTAEDSQAYIDKIKLGTEAENIKELSQQRVDVEKLILNMKGADPKVAKQLQELQDVTNRASIKKVKESMMSLKEKLESKGATVGWDMEQMLNKVEQSLVLSSYIKTPTRGSQLGNGAANAASTSAQAARKGNIDNLGKFMAGLEKMLAVNDALPNPRDMAKVGDMLSQLGEQYQDLINAGSADEVNSAMGVLGTGLTYHLDLLNSEISKGAQIDDAFAALSIPVGIRADRLTPDAVIDPDDPAGVGANLPAQPASEQQAGIDEEIKGREESEIVENPWPGGDARSAPRAPVNAIIKDISSSMGVDISASGMETVRSKAKEFLIEQGIDPNMPMARELDTAIHAAIESSARYATLGRQSNRMESKKATVR
jgi:hypothetical protein